MTPCQAAKPVQIAARLEWVTSARTLGYPQRPIIIFFLSHFVHLIFRTSMDCAICFKCRFKLELLNAVLLVSIEYILQEICENVYSYPEILRPGGFLAVFPDTLSKHRSTCSIFHLITTTNDNYLSRQICRANFWISNELSITKIE